MMKVMHIVQRTAEIGNWTGKAIYSPRAKIEKILARNELHKPGVYILKSPPDSDLYNEKIYIGEGEDVSKRLQSHLKDPDKDFWTEFICFTSKDAMLTKTHVKYLESRLISSAKEYKSSEVVNSNVSNLPYISEVDQSDLEYFLEQIKLILPLMGFRFLIRSTIDQEDLQQRPIQDEYEYYQIRSSKIDAKMYETDEGFIVTTGSKCNRDTSNSISEGWIHLREKLLKTGSMVDRGEYYEFIEDVIFSSPSAAASVILGRQAAGPREWVTEDGGVSYKEKKAKAIKEKSNK